LTTFLLINIVELDNEKLDIGGYMFNLIIAYDEDYISKNKIELKKDRYLEYTVEEIKTKFKSLHNDVIDKVKTFPTLLMVEQERADSKIGKITNINLKQDSIIIEFMLLESVPSIGSGKIESIKDKLDINDWELSRTHWAIKDVDLFKELEDSSITAVKNYEFSKKDGAFIANKKESKLGDFNKNQIFIVHGHDDDLKGEVEKYITDLGFEAVILHKQANRGRTIIEKIEKYSNVGFAIVLYTPCDWGMKAGNMVFNLRARQNVIFEHGFLIGKLGRDRVVALKKDNIETPSDINGVLYIEHDKNGDWKEKIIKELVDVGYCIENLNSAGHARIFAD
jgi:predicted nucleotide-binding protein